MEITKQKTALEAKVIAQNRANKEANRLFPLFVAALTPFLGKQIFLVGGGFRSPVRKILLDIANQSTAFQVLPNLSYGVKYIVKECEGYSDYTCVYAEAHLYVGEVQGLNLSLLHDAPNFSENFTTDKICEARQRVIKTRSELSQAQGALGDFGEYDH